MKELQWSAGPVFQPAGGRAAGLRRGREVFEGEELFSRIALRLALGLLGLLIGLLGGGHLLGSCFNDLPRLLTDSGRSNISESQTSYAC